MTASFVAYDGFKDAHRILERWAAAAGDAVPVPVLFLSLPGDFAVVAVFSLGIVLKFAQADRPESFANDFPTAVEAHALIVR